MTNESDFSTVLEIADLSCRNIKDFGGLFRSQPVSKFLISQSFKQCMYHVMKICHTLKHHVKRLFFDLYYFHSLCYQEVSN